MSFIGLWFVYTIAVGIYMSPFIYSLKLARRKFKEKKYVKAIGVVFGGILISAILKVVVTGVVKVFLLSHGVH